MCVRKLTPTFILLASCLFPTLIGCWTWDVLPDADVTAITAIVKDVYGREGRGRMIFLGVEEEATVLQESMSRLEAELNTRVLPESEVERVVDDSHPPLTPIDPVTGEVGIWIGLGRFTVDGQGLLRVVVSFARSGLDGAVYEYVLEPTANGWSVLEARMVAIA